MSDEVAGRSRVNWTVTARRTLASTVSVGMAAIMIRAFASEASSAEPHAIWIPVCIIVGAPLLSAAAIWTRVLGLQLLARAYWWAQLLFASLVSLTGVTDRRVAALAIGSACALLSAGRLGLDETAGGWFRPVAFRGTLMLALVLAMADAGTFSWLGMLQAADGKARLIFFAPPMIAAVIGLLQLRTWGLLVSVVCNLLVAGLAAARLLDLPDDLRRLFIGNAIAQLLIPLPMWVAIIRRRAPAPDGWRRTKLVASTAVILLLAVANIVVMFARVRYDAP